MIIIFDFNGTIDNSYELHYQLMKKKILKLSREEHKRLFEGNFHKEREKLKHRDNGFDIVKEFSIARSNDIMDDNKKEILKELSKNNILGIISSSSEKGTNNILLQNKIKELFSFHYGFETHKSKVEKFKMILNQYPNEKYIFVTDTLGDILEAKEVNIPTIAYTEGYHERERLEKGKPYAIINDFNEIHDLIKQF